MRDNKDIMVSTIIFLISLCFSLASKIVMMLFPEKKLARMNGILQSFTGFGMLVGPILGSVLFNLGGFQLPFYSVGVLLLLLALLNHCMIPASLDRSVLEISETLSHTLSNNASLNNSVTRQPVDNGRMETNESSDRTPLR